MQRRPDPEQLLRQAQAEEEYAQRGRLKIFLGYSSGVGKSFRMLDEGRRRHERGQDVVVGAIQAISPPEAVALLARLESIPMLDVNGVPAMDVAAILERRPQVCLVDGLAHANPPGSARAQRWQDVEALLAAGVSILTTVNLQFIAEHQAEVARLTGEPVVDTVPESFLRTADEIEIVDAPPDAGINLPGALAEELAHRRRQQLSELREIALLLAADVVDRQLTAYLRRHGIEPLRGTQERILVCITDGAGAQAMIASGRRNAERFHGELFVVHVRPPDAPPPEPALAHNLELARAAQAQVELLEGEDFVATILRFARERGVTQIFLGHTLRETWWQRLTGTALDRLIARAEGIDIRIFPHHEGRGHG